MNKAFLPLRALAIAALLLCATLPGMAQTANNAYIFYNANHGYLINNNGNPGVSTTFNKNAIWIANNTMGGTSRNVHSYTDDTKFFTGSNGTNRADGTFSLGASNNNWRIANNFLNRAGNNRGYVRYNGTGFIVNSSNTDQNLTGLAITINSSTPSNPTINITAAGLSGGGIQLTGNVTGSYTPTYYYSTVRNYNNTTTQTYYWTTTTNATTTQPASISSWGDATRTWTVTTGGAYASVSNDGLVTITGNPTGNIVVTLTVTKGGYEGTQTFTLTRAAAAQATNTVSTINSLGVSPNSAALYVSESQAFTASATVNSTTYTTPAHTTLTGGGNTYRYYNGTLYTNAEDFSSQSSTTTTPTYAWSMTGGGSGNASLSATNGASTTLTHTPGVDADKTLTLTVEASYTGATPQSRSVQVTLYAPFVAPTITRSGNNISLSTASLGVTIYYTTDGSTPTASNGTAYTGPFNLEELSLPVTVKAIAVRNGESTTVAQQTYSSLAMEPPIISISLSGAVTITSATAGASIRYTTDGTTPTSSSGTVYSGSFNVSNLTTVKAIAYKAGYEDSEVASETYITSGINGGVVILNDLEDHRWSYYGAKPDIDYPDQLLSPDPRNVKITYDGNGAEVSYNESQNEFVYYKTIEKVGGTYTYKVIPNPFSKRPTVGTGDTRWRGFGGWKIISGAEYISGHSNNDVLDLEETLTLTGLDAGYTPNCLSATIELQATWVQAYVSTVDAAGGIDSRPNTLTGDTYETNFIVILDNNAHAVSGTGRVTISNRYPDGSAGGNGTVNGCTTAADGTKVEFTNISGTFTEATGQLIVGRGCTGTVSDVTGTNADRIKDIRLESGTYSFVHPMNDLGDNAANRGNFVFGCDYDRANITDAHPYGDNTKLRIKVFTSTQSNDAGHGGHANNNTDSLLNITVKSGYYGFTSDFASWQSDKTDGWGLGIGGNTDNFGDNYVVPDETGTMRTYTYGTKPPQNTMSFYVGPTRGGGKGGKNYLRIEGGELSSVNGGGTTTPDDSIRFDFRMTGGWVKGAVYGGASATDCYGSSKIVITGGEVNSWIGGGCNGTDIDAGAGATNGTIYIYAGGNAQIRSHNSDGVYNNAWGLVNHIEGGQIYGGGRGMGAPGSYSGSATNAFVVVADEAFVEQNVYGGSCHGVSQYGYVYILGGTVGKKVFGGSFEPTSTNSTWQARNTYVRMYGGLVKGGLYGGNDESGTVTQNAEVLVLGGQVGADADHPGYVFGGGYGQSTFVNGNITVTLGQADATDSATVYGNVYGGSALGSVNTNTSNTTVVTMHKGLVNGNLFGGALGQASPLIEAPVNGLITVNIRGGRVNGSVFGGGDVAPYGRNGQNYPVVNMTGGTVTDLFGGGKGATAAVTGNPQVNLSGKARVTHNVYGGGDQAAVTGNPNVILR